MKRTLEDSPTRREFLSSVVVTGGLSALFAADEKSAYASGQGKSGLPNRLEMDSVGRAVFLPHAIQAVAPARPSVQDILIAAAPDKVGVLAYADSKVLSKSEFSIVGALCDKLDCGLDVSMRDLDVDLIVDVENDASWTKETADKLQSESGVPVYVIKRGVQELSDVFSELGTLFDEKRCKDLAKYITSVHVQLLEELSQIRSEDKPKIAFVNKIFDTDFGYGQNLLQEELATLAGGNLVKLAGEKACIAAVECDVIVAFDSRVVDALLNPADIRGITWINTAAVKNKKVYCLDMSDICRDRGMPLLPWAVVGLQWLASILHPGLIERDIEKIKQEYLDKFFPLCEGSVS